MNIPPQIFDRNAVRMHRNRAAVHFSEHDFLFKEAAERLVERLDDTTKTFPGALIIGSHQNIVAEALHGKNGIETLVQMDNSWGMLGKTNGLAVQADEEFLPFAPGSFDLIVSVLDLHWVNDLPGTLVQLQRILRKDGLLLVSLFGGETLKELRQAVLQAAMEGQGVSPRISPFIDVKEAGGLLQRAGFGLPVGDTDTITVSYSNAFRLLQDLHGMGEANALLKRRSQLTSKRELYAIVEKYHEIFSNLEGCVPASFEIVTLTGWKV